MYCVCCSKSDNRRRKHRRRPDPKDESRRLGTNMDKRQQQTVSSSVHPAMTPSPSPRQPRQGFPPPPKAGPKSLRPSPSPRQAIDSISSIFLIPMLLLLRTKVVTMTKFHVDWMARCTCSRDVHRTCKVTHKNKQNIFTLEIITSFSWPIVVHYCHNNGRQGTGHRGGNHNHDTLRVRRWGRSFRQEYLT